MTFKCKWHYKYQNTNQTLIDNNLRQSILALIIPSVQWNGEYGKVTDSTMFANYFKKKTKTKSEKKYKNQWHLALLTVFGVEVDVNHFYDLAFPMQISGGKQCCEMFRALVLD